MISWRTRSTLSETEENHADILGECQDDSGRLHQGHDSSTEPVRRNGDAESNVWGQAHVGFCISRCLTIIRSRCKCNVSRFAADASQQLPSTVNTLSLRLPLIRFADANGLFYSRQQIISNPAIPRLARCSCWIVTLYD